MFRQLKSIPIASFRAVLDLYQYRHITNACALSYTTLLSIIPLLSVIIYTGSLSNYFADLNSLARSYAAQNLLPSANDKVLYYLDILTTQANLAPTLSFAFLFVTAILLLMSIDTTMSVVWENRRRKRKWLHFLFYLTGIIAIPTIIATGSLLSTFIDFIFSSLPLISVFKFAIPWVINSLMLSILYYITAARTLSYRNIFIGSVFASILLELVKFLFTLYVTHLANYQTIYGALAIIPIFLLWIFIFWTTIIYGALVAKNCLTSP